MIRCLVSDPVTSDSRLQTASASRDPNQPLEGSKSTGFRQPRQVKQLYDSSKDSE